jgi:hypothetical protein
MKHPRPYQAYKFTLKDFLLFVFMAVVILSCLLLQTAVNDVQEATQAPQVAIPHTHAEFTAAEIDRGQLWIFMYGAQQVQEVYRADFIGIINDLAEIEGKLIEKKVIK